MQSRNYSQKTISEGCKDSTEAFNLTVWAGENGLYALTNFQLHLIARIAIQHRYYETFK
jgi:hypothetical protein